MDKPRVSNEELEREARRAQNTLDGKFPVESWPVFSRYALDLRDARRRIAELENDAERVRTNAFNEAVDSLKAQCAAWIDADVTDSYDKFTDEAVDELLKIAAQRQKEGE